MGGITKSISDFLEEIISFSELSKEVKDILIASKIVNESGEYTDTGLAFKAAYSAKPEPGASGRSGEWPYNYR